MDKAKFPASLSRIRQFFAGENRSSKAKKNILGSFVIKGASIFISLLLVPLTLNYLTPYEYGVWLTLSAIFTWINYLDIGLVNGLRNKLAEIFATQNRELGRIYVSTTFFLLSAILTACFLLFLLIQPFLNWSVILNVDPSTVSHINSIIILAFGFFCLTLILKLTGIVLIADQRPATNDLITLAGSALSLLLIFFLTKTTPGSLNLVILVFTASPAVALLISYPLVFRNRYSYLKPSFRYIRLACTKDLMGLGIQFFIMQISGIILFSSTNIIISQILNPELVTPYNIAFKYFSFVTLFFGFIITPMWSATTDAYSKGDLEWIRKAVKSMLIVCALCVSGILLMILLSSFAYHLWIGTQVQIPILLTLLMGAYAGLLLWSVCFSTFLFGIGRLKLQMINLLFVATLFIPLAIFLTKKYGLNGVVIALILSNLSGAILNPIQLKRILDGTASGIWNR